MNTLLLGINILIGYLIWKYMWRPTSLDDSRDQLFDLRDEVRTWYMDQGIPLDHRTYQALRKLLNAHLRYTQKLTFGSFIATTIAMQGKDTLIEQVRKEVDDLFKTEDERIEKYVKKVRQKSVEILLGYMAKTSVPILVIVFLVTIFFTILNVKKFAASVWHESKEKKIGFFPSVKHVLCSSFIALILTLPVRAGIVNERLDSSVIEEYSYRM